MITKANLYWDTIKRIPLRQNFFLVKEKILKKILPIKISSIEKIGNKLYSEEIWSRFLQNSDKLINRKDSKMFWDSGVLENNFQYHYLSFVQNKLDEYKKADNIEILEKLWKTKHDDIEFIYNIQRMYKFKEIMDVLNFTDYQKLNVINSWIDNHPPQKGASWMGFNCSIRLINWIKVLTSLKNINTIKEEDVKKIFLSILQNLEFITNNIEHHIPGNHVIFQYFSAWLTLFLIGDKKTEVYSKLFVNEFEDDFLESGLHFELSTHYHLQVLQLGVYYSLINQKKNKNELLGTIEKAYFIIDAFSFSKNNLPLIGDNCYNFFHNNLVEDAENLNYLKDNFDFTEKNKSETFEIDDQYIVVNKEKSKLILDIGNIGMKQNPGHGHSDILSVNYSCNGIPIFVDSGTKRYSNLPENLELKRANSHNTISINNEDQSKLWGFFRWAFLPDKTIYSYKKVENSVILEASFRGFKNIGGAKHSRKIEISDSELVVSDNVEYNQLRTVEQNFILSEFVSIEEVLAKYYLNIDDYKFEFIVDSDKSYSLEVLPHKIYKSYDNPVDSNKIRIVYNTSSSTLETNIKLKLVNE